MSSRYIKSTSFSVFSWYEFSSSTNFYWQLSILSMIDSRLYFCLFCTLLWLLCAYCLNLWIFCWSARLNSIMLASSSFVSTSSANWYLTNRLGKFRNAMPTYGSSLSSWTSVLSVLSLIAWRLEALCEPSVNYWFSAESASICVYFRTLPITYLRNCCFWVGDKCK